MRDDVFRKGDPRLRRLLRQPTKSGGFLGAFFRAEPPPGEELIVSLRKDAPPRAFEGLRWNRIGNRLYTVEIDRQQVTALLRSDEVESVEAPRSMRGETLESLPAMNVHAIHTGSPKRTGHGVVIGVIDFDLDFTLHDFRTKDGNTRVAWLWDQTGTAGVGETAPFGYGVEYGEDTINRALASPSPHLIVRHVARSSHGTHVTGIAASSARVEDDPKRFHGVAPDARLIFVNLAMNRRGAARTGPDNVTTSIRVVEALSYIFNKVEEMGRPPCVVNMSLAQNASGHDGESFVELHIDSLLDRTYGRAVVVAAGNDAAAGVHAEWTYKAGMSKELTFTIPNKAKGVCELEAWYSSRDTISVAVRRPGDRDFSPAATPPFDDTIRVGKTDVLILSRRFDPLGGDASIYVSIGENDTSLPDGDWTIRFDVSADSHPGMLHAWAERKVPQPHFADDIARMSTTLGSPATARRCISVGNVDRDRAPNSSSGRGPTRDGRSKPDVAAPGTGIVSCCPVTTGSASQREAMTGTSMSAPHVAGVVACLLEEDPDLTPAQIRKLLIAATDRDEFDPALGFGFVDAAAALRLLREQL